MRRMPPVLLSAAAILWGTAIGLDAEDGRARIWIPLLAAACVMTVAGLHLLTVQSAVRANDALTRVILSRPLTRFDTGPLPAVPPLPPPRLAAVDGHGGQHRKRHGQPASQGSADISGPREGRGL